MTTTRRTTTNRGPISALFSMALAGLATGAVAVTPPPPVVIDGSGAGCAAAGIWHAAERRCEFTRDVRGVDVRADFVTVDCAGRWVDPASASYTIGVTDRTGVTVRDCNVTGADDGIVFRNSRDGRIEGNVVAGSTTAGIAIIDSHGNTITGNEGIENDFLIMMQGSNENVVEGNWTDSDQNGVQVGTSDDNVFRNNSVSPTAFFGFSVYNSSSNLFEGNSASFSNPEAEAAFEIRGGTSNQIIGGQFSYARRGIAVSASDRVTVRGTIVRNVAEGIVISNSTEGTIEENAVTCNFENFAVYDPACVRVAGSSDVTLLRNTIQHDLDPGIPTREHAAVFGTIQAIRIDGGSANVVDGTSVSGWVHAISVVDTVDAKVQHFEATDNVLGIVVTRADRTLVLASTASRNHSGIYVTESTGVWAAGVVASDNAGAGIYFARAPGAYAYGNQVTGNGAGGIFLVSSTGGWVAENTAVGNWLGIVISGTDESRVNRNEMRDNHVGMFVMGERNVIKRNVSFDNADLGFYDHSTGTWTRGTANRYRSNRCEGNGTAGSMPGGLCRES